MQQSRHYLFVPALHEFSRVVDNVSENFPNPFDQAYRHQLFLEHQFKAWQISIPVYHIVVLANHRATLDHSLSNFPIMHMSGIPRFIEKLYRQYPNPRANITLLQNQLEQLSNSFPLVGPLKGTGYVMAFSVRIAIMSMRCIIDKVILFARCAG